MENETDGEMLQRLGMDGRLWAQEFSKTAMKLGYAEMDEGWLIAWFCNAIMAGYDEALRRIRQPATNKKLWEFKCPMCSAVCRSLGNNQYLCPNKCDYLKALAETDMGVRSDTPDVVSPAPAKLTLADVLEDIDQFLDAIRCGCYSVSDSMIDKAAELLADLRNTMGDRLATSDGKPQEDALGNSSPASDSRENYPWKCKNGEIMRQSMGARMQVKPFPPMLPGDFIKVTSEEAKRINDHCQALYEAAKASDQPDKVSLHDCVMAAEESMLGKDYPVSYANTEILVKAVLTAANVKWRE